ncbi:MAG: acyl-CoA dehydrogenase, partial [Roseiarcus sp.]
MSLEDLAIQAQNAVETLLARASALLRERLSEGGRLSAAKIEREQHATHGLAWLATYVEAIKQLGGYAGRMSADGRFGETEELVTRIGLSEYLAQIFGGIAMNQGEIVRLADFGLRESVIAPLRAGAVAELIETGATVET